MKLSDEEIKRESIIEGWPCGDAHAAFRDGARFAESRLLPFVEANDWLLIDTPEKKRALGHVKEGDEFWDNSAWWVVPSESSGGLLPRFIYRRKIQWHKVSETPIPKGVPIYLLADTGNEQGLNLFAVEQLEHYCAVGKIIYWRYWNRPTPPQIDKEREAFEKAFEDANKDGSFVKHGECYELALKIWQAAQSAARKEGK